MHLCESVAGELGLEGHNMNANDTVHPDIGGWYFRADTGELFQVVGLDDRSDTIETQSFDGDLGEMEADTWSTLTLESCAPPEDWTGPIDDVETDYLDCAET